MKKSIFLLTILLLEMEVIGMAGAEPVIKVPMVEEPPVIDGSLDEPCWQKAAKISEFILQNTGLSAKEKSEVLLTYDAENLYLAFIAYESQMGRITAAKPWLETEEIFQGDVIEIFVGPKDTGYFQICANVEGTRFDRSANEGPSWNGLWRSGQSKYPDRWCVEVAIPFIDFPEAGEFIGTPAAGATWRLALARSEIPKGEKSFWPVAFERPTLTAPPLDSNFGKITFTGSENHPNVKVNPPPGSVYGPGVIRLTVQNPTNESKEVRSYLAVNSEEIPARVEIPPHKEKTVELKYSLNSPGSHKIYLEITDLETERLLHLSKAEFSLPDFSSVLNSSKEKLKNWEKLPKNLPKEVLEIRQFYERASSLLREVQGLQEELTTSSRLTNEQWARITRQIRTLTEEMPILEREAIKLKAFTVFCSQVAKPEFGLSWESSLERLFPNKTFSGEISADYSLSGARNEYVACQLAVIPFWKDLAGVNIEAGDLIGKDGHILGRQNIEIRRIGYVHLSKPPFPVKYPDQGPWWPDPLFPLTIPLTEFAFPGERSLQSFWVTVYIPESTPPGDYQGKIRVVTTNSHSLVAVLKLKVWDFTLSKKSHLRTDFWFSGNVLEMFYFREIDIDMYKQWAEFLWKYRLGSYLQEPRPIQRVKIWREPDGAYSFDFSELDQFTEVSMANGCNAYNMNLSCSDGACGLTSIIGGPEYVKAVKDKATGVLIDWKNESKEEQEKLFVQFWKAYVQHFKEKGWFDVAHYQGIDEPSSRTRPPQLEHIYQLIRKTAPDLKRMSAGARPGYNLDDLMEIWCPQMDSFDPKIYEKERRKGKEIWWYICWDPSYPYANFHIPDLTTGYRLLFWMSWKYKIDGFLYWGTAYWTDRTGKLWQRDPTKRWPNSEWKTDLFGDGYLVYPGPDGPWPSIRLENIRDGLEDYEYFYLLKELTDEVRKIDQQGRYSSLIETSNKLLEVNPEVVKSLTEYTEKPVIILEERNRLANQIIEIRNALKILGQEIKD
ncbi:MAG: glycoside hydrolase domain-containing protein [Candidatus Zixiibacteriota bacterium]